MGNREGEALWSGNDGGPCGAKVVLAEWPCLQPLPGMATSGVSPEESPGGQVLGSGHRGHSSCVQKETQNLLAKLPGTSQRCSSLYRRGLSFLI